MFDQPPGFPWMKPVGWIVFSLAITACDIPPIAVYAPDIESRNIHFSNGRWFDGEGFAERAFYSVDGILSSQRPETLDAVIDLQGAFVVPPYGEAHQHNVDADNGTFDQLNEAYLTAGIFYLKNPNTLPRTLPRTLTLVNRPTTIDAAFSGGGVTGSGGHPTQIAQRNVDRGYWTAADLEGGFVYTIDDVTELETRWPEISQASPKPPG